jgi:hypothetical protein
MITALAIGLMVFGAGVAVGAIVAVFALEDLH